MTHFLSFLVIFCTADSCQGLKVKSIQFKVSSKLFVEVAHTHVMKPHNSPKFYAIACLLLEMSKIITLF